MTYTNRGGFGGRNTGRSSFGDRGYERPQMHQAICDQCGKECEVPFRPNGSKPIFCSQCFEKQNGGSDRVTVRRFDRDGGSRRDSDRPAFRDNRGDFNRPRFENRDEKPSQRQVDSTGDFAALNKKLDKIIELLSPKQEAIVEVKVEKKAKKSKKAKVAVEE